MRVIATPSAPEQARRAISLCQIRWLSGIVPTIFLAVFLGFAWGVMLPDQPSDKPLLLRFTVGLVAFMIFWWWLICWRPKRVYRKHVAAGNIIEVRDPEILAYADDFWSSLEVRVNALREAELKRFIDTIIEVNPVAATDPDLVHHRLAEERARYGGITAE